MRDRRAVAIVASAGVAVLAIVLVVLTSLVRIPEFATLQESPQTGTVVYGRESDEPRGTWVVVDLTSGERTTLSTARESELVGWDDDGIVLVEYGPSTQRELVVDPRTGEVVSESAVDESAGDRVWADPVWTEHEDGEIRFVQEFDDVVASFPAPDSYDVTTASSMGDGRVVFVDELGRVAIVTGVADAVPVLVGDDAVPWQQVLGQA
jgi:hypothetical protein